MDMHIPLIFVCISQTFTLFCHLSDVSVLLKILNTKLTITKISEKKPAFSKFGK